MSIHSLSYVALYSHLAPVTAGLAKYRGLSRPMKILAVLSSLFFFEFAIEIAYALSKMNNLEIGNVGQIMETVVICCIFIVAVNTKKIKLIQSSLLGFYLIIATVTMVFVHTPHQLDTIGVAMGKITMLCSSVIYLYYALTHDTTPITQDPVFWVAVGNLLYNAGTIILFSLVNNYALIGKENFLMAYNINYILIMVMNVFYTKGFLCNAQ